MSTSIHPLDNKILLSRYRVIRLLGEGGMGTVHLARVEGAEGFTRPVVVKRMKRDLRTTDEGNRLFIREAKILSKLQHPGIVGISDFGIDDGVPTMVLEYVHGYTLSPWLTYRVAKKLPLPVDICLYLMRRVLDALHYAHRFNTEEGNELEIVHRDISPDNVLVSNRGYVHLLDFGIASIRGPQGVAATQTEGFRGKLCYAAPETVIGERATPRSDQYSAAVVLLEMLTGVTPFEANSVAETFMRMVRDTPEPPSKSRDDIPPGLDEALAKALAKDPLVRFDSALSFSRELRRLQSRDDDDIAEQLRELVQHDFEEMPTVVHVEPLRDRQAALERLLSTAPQAALPVLEIPDADATELAHGHTARAATILGTAAAVPGGGVSGPSRQLTGLLWGLIVVGGLIAVGLGATVAVLSKRSSTPQEQQVVVVGGGRDVQPAIEPAFAAPLAVDDAVHAGTTIANEPGASGASAEKGAASDALRVHAKVATATAATGVGQAQLSQAVQQKSGSFQACFVQHLEAGQVAPQAVLHFDVAKSGGAAQVKAEPPAVANTPLGRCLVQAGSSVRFPSLDQPVSFRVPVRARVSRSSGK